MRGHWVPKSWLITPFTPSWSQSCNSVGACVHLVKFIFTIRTCSLSFLKDVSVTRKKSHCKMTCKKEFKTYVIYKYRLMLNFLLSVCIRME